MNTPKIVRKFCEKSLMPYKRTLKEVRLLTADQRGARLKAMKEFLANTNLALPDENQQRTGSIEPNGIL